MHSPPTLPTHTHALHAHTCICTHTHFHAALLSPTLFEDALWHVALPHSHARTSSHKPIPPTHTHSLIHYLTFTAPSGGVATHPLCAPSPFFPAFRPGRRTGTVPTPLHTPCTPRLCSPPYIHTTGREHGPDRLNSVYFHIALHTVFSVQYLLRHLHARQPHHGSPSPPSCTQVKTHTRQQPHTSTDNHSDNNHNHIILQD